MADEHPPQYGRHLEFLGYQCEWQPDGWLYAVHPVRWNFFLRPVDAGVRFHCTIRLGPLSDEKRFAWLEFLNRGNEQSLITRFTLERDDGRTDFVVRARTLVAGTYRRRDFGVSMDMWHDDMTLLRGGPAVEEEDEDHDEDAAKATDDVTVH